MDRLADIKFDSIGFDLDGTLWDGTGAIANAWKDYMKNIPDIKRIPDADDLKKLMGLPMDVILERLFPYFGDERRKVLLEETKVAEQSYIRKNGGALFDGVEEILNMLSNKYKLFVVSNCQPGYIESFLYYYKLEKYFCDFECIGNTGMPKGRNIKTVIERNSFESAAYVGDTQGDCDAAAEAGVPFIFAAYGFGNAEGNIYRKVNSFKELARL